MTAPSPDAAQPPVPQRPMPSLGRGIGWSAHIDGEMPKTEPYVPKDRPRPTSWPKTGTVGASTTLRDDEQPAAVEARPYATPVRDFVAEFPLVPNPPSRRGWRRLIPRRTT